MRHIINVPAGRLAGFDPVAERAAAEREKRQRIKEAMEKGEPMPLAQGGKAAQPGEASFTTPPGKLAAPWYEQRPDLLEMEKMVMARNFPQFQLDKLSDGRLCWLGTIEPGIYESKFGEKREYYLMAVYDNNHPNQQMGSSVRVYPLDPNVDELIKTAGFQPHHLLVDANGNLYLCTNEAGDQHVGKTVTTAAGVLSWAAKWLIAYELVLTGDLPLTKFQEHGGV